jgi:hypothetical protein
VQEAEEVYNPCIDERCEDCSYCSRTKPCSCDCGLLGGSCKKGYFLDTGGYFDDDEEEESEEEDSDDEIQPHCQICFNMNSNLFVTKNALKPVCSGKCVAKLIEKHKSEDSDDDVPVAQLIQRKVAENKQTVADLLLEKNKKQEELKQINRAISDLKRTPKKRAEEKMVPLRPTYNLAEKKPTKQFKNNSQKYTLFRHNKPVKGWCKYALYNSKNNNYMECNFDGEKVTDWANGKIHKTLNAWTTSNLLEQCARENKPRKTVKNNAYKETNFIYMNLDEKKMIYTSAEKPTKLNPIAWLKSIILIDKQSELAVDWTYEKVGKKTKAKMVYVENK